MATVAVIGGQLRAGNLGVSALGMATAAQLHRACPSVLLVLQDSYRDAQQATVRYNGTTAQADSLFLHTSKRLRDRCGTRYVATFGQIANWTPEWLFRKTPVENRTLRQMLQTDAVIDLSAGDSFSDIYGENCFAAQAAMKRMVLRLGKSLILGPQTYGPFIAGEVRQEARSLIEQASLVATREQNGLDELRDLLGRELDDRFCQCPDVAFSLEAEEIDISREPFLAAGGAEPLVGLNVSGLLYVSQRDFGLSFSYRDFTHRVLRWLVEEAGVRVVLVPHVLSHYRIKNRRPAQGDFADVEACQALLDALEPKLAERVGVLSQQYNSAQIKSVLKMCDFFIGARMHACIGALSQGVPTATVAYSKKVDGVMSLARVSQTVVDPRRSSLDGCLEEVRQAHEKRQEFREHLSAVMPDVRRRIMEFFAERLAPAIVDQPAAIA